ncbi:MAG: helix-turn-helix transcriptional regulator [Clostridia bacterium]|nr:helix-turn-helix transcriptional regulator [Clostridia bacterium]
MDIHERIKHLMAERNWSAYRLSEESGLAQTTIYNIFKNNTTPNWYTLESICNGFGITLAQFFAEGDMVELTPELKEVFDCWVNLTVEQKQAVVNIMRVMSHDK